jgi:murein L,D-transpeptidase YafK
MRAVIVLLLSFLSTASFAAEKADRVVVEKSQRTLSLYSNDKLLATYPVVFGANPEGHKQQEGDERTPEGHYTLDYKKSDSAFYKAIHISYPNANDIESARKLGISPGGAIMVHGQRNGLGWAWFIARFFNWTDGCVALSNDDMESVWVTVDTGTPIEIRP